MCVCVCVCVCALAQAFDSDQLTVTDSCGDGIRRRRQVAERNLEAGVRLWGKRLSRRRYSGLVIQTCRETKQEPFFSGVSECVLWYPVTKLSGVFLSLETSEGNSPS